MLAVKPHPRETLRAEDLPSGPRVTTVLAPAGHPWALSMAADLVIVPARVGEHEDNSEYEEILPTSPP